MGNMSSNFGIRCNDWASLKKDFQRLPEKGHLNQLETDHEILKLKISNWKSAPALQGIPLCVEMFLKPTITFKFFTSNTLKRGDFKPIGKYGHRKKVVDI